MPAHDNPIAISTMLISDVLDAYLLERNASERYRESLRRTVKRLAAYGIKNTCQLTTDSVQKFLAAVPVGQTTRHNYRRETYTLWRFAFERAVTDVAPRLRRIPPARRPVRAWTLEQVQHLLALSERDQTFLHSKTDVRRRHVLPAWILVAWDSGLRFSDVLNLRHSDIRNGCVSVVVSKTGCVETRRLSPACAAAIKALPRSPDGSLFRWVLNRRAAMKMWRGFLDANGVEGSSKYLRRAGATQVTANHGPQAASAFLGHSPGNEHLARLHYIDASLAMIPKGPPPLR